MFAEYPKRFAVTIKPPSGREGDHTNVWWKEPAIEPFCILRRSLGQRVIV